MEYVQLGYSLRIDTSRILKHEQTTNIANSSFQFQPQLLRQYAAGLKEYGNGKLRTCKTMYIFSKALS
jgi:hypothetical protein